MKKLVWDMFRKTGKIEYYLKFKELERLEQNKNEEV